MKIRINNKGFSLLELLIVIALIAILASMVLMATMGSWTDANTRLTKSTMALLDGALEDYQEYKPYNPDDPTNLFKFPDPNALSKTVDFSSVEHPVETLHSASLYERINSVPDAKKILERIADSQITLIEATGGSKHPVFLDAWKTTLNYLYVPGLNNFPVIISAGPDKKFDTADDITNKK
jgi:prepilin-type N-terminal cleavage/methylation domain-containing protein